MLVRIATENLCVGMFIHKFEARWLDTPFFRSQLHVKNQAMIDEIRDSGIFHVIIDDERAIDAEPEKSNIQTFTGAESMPKNDSYDGVKWQAQPVVYAGQAAFRTNAERQTAVRKAKATLNRAKAAVKQMFDDARMGRAIKTTKMASLVNQITASIDQDPSVILNLARLKRKDDYTYLHSVSVCALMINLGRKMHLPEPMVRECGMAGLLHDVGKLAIPNDILLKPSALDETEFQIVRDHPLAGYKILAAANGVSDAALDVCLHHHEKMDGTGYPHALNGEDLGLMTRMAAICDVYDAVTSQRSYNRPWSPSEALAKMQSWEGHFDKLIFQSFVSSLGILPRGTVVRLSNNHLAVVLGESGADYFLPRVRMFFSAETRLEVPPCDFDIVRSEKCWQIAGVECPEKWGVRDLASRILSH
jgi:HD-GYP domain-containing protein (c-di-GMP phosphodiesterase class II)